MCGQGKPHWQTLHAVHDHGRTRWVIHEGATNSSACKCQQGFLEVAGDCLPCPVGLDCQTYHDGPPKTLPRYVASGDTASKDVQIYKCVSVDACPGGLTAACGTGGLPFARGVRQRHNPSVHSCILTENVKNLLIETSHK